ncbi:MAG: hypothetical protein U0354_15765 [Candidatus Sericytochromatia bacterium]
MFNLEDLAKAKTKVKDIRKQNSGNAYEEGFKILEEFENGEADKEQLAIAGDNIIEALKFDPENVEAYVCLSYIFYVLGEDQVALKYVQIAEEIFGEELPLELEDFKQNLISSIELEIGNVDKLFSNNNEQDDNTEEEID